MATAPADVGGDGGKATLAASAGTILETSAVPTRPSTPSASGGLWPAFLDILSHWGAAAEAVHGHVFPEFAVKEQAMGKFPCCWTDKYDKMAEAANQVYSELSAASRDLGVVSHSEMINAKPGIKATEAVDDAMEILDPLTEFSPIQELREKGPHHHPFVESVQSSERPASGKQGAVPSILLAAAVLGSAAPSEGKWLFPLTANASDSEHVSGAVIANLPAWTRGVTASPCYCCQTTTKRCDGDSIIGGKDSQKKCGYRKHGDAGRTARFL
eukprot:TRINITY_DN58453_c0_g1_i1.p1 TRINITY_DN58453_c0_g1~~TRINITY_DN58453_c0_g1_i1.p1  ORF type:complete len:318 (-),score=47.96 TRINITY_DN58453_c0_g1_i1:102-914(-)